MIRVDISSKDGFLHDRHMHQFGPVRRVSDTGSHMRGEIWGLTVVRTSRVFETIHEISSGLGSSWIDLGKQYADHSF